MNATPMLLSARLRARGQRRHSGVQMDVLRLYRGLLREAQRRTDEATRLALAAYVRAQFRTHGAIPRKEVSQIEWHLHYGRTKLEELRAQKPTTRFNIVS